MSEQLHRRIEELSARIEDVSRRMASVMLSGKVAEIEGHKVRVELGKDPKTGKKFLSPWVQLQEMAGATASNFPVKEGDPIRLFSPNGEIGEQSLAVRDSHTEEHPNPAEKNTDLVLTFGGCKIIMQDGKLTLSAGESSVEVSGDTITLKSDNLKHNVKEIGDTHKHLGVVAGGDITDVPV